MIICTNFWQPLKPQIPRITRIFCCRNFFHPQTTTNSHKPSSCWISLNLREPWWYAMIHACHHWRWRKSHHNIGHAFGMFQCKHQYHRIENKPKVTMFAVEMWFGVGEGVEYGRSTGLCPLPLGVPRCVIHNKKNVGTKFLVILKNNYKNHQNHSNNAKKQKNWQWYTCWL